MPGRNRPNRRALASVALVAVALVGLGPSCTKTGDPTATARPDDKPPATAPGGAVVFPLPEDTGGAVKRAGLFLSPKEATEVQYRSHLDVVVEGKAVTVPAGIGVGKDPVEYAPIHTHDDSGVVHVTVSDPDQVFRVGQLFQAWGVSLEKLCLARTLCADADHQLLGFANGQLVPDPGSIPFRDGEEIVIWYGPKGTNPAIPTSYAFPPGTTVP